MLSYLKGNRQVISHKTRVQSEDIFQDKPWSQYQAMYFGPISAEDLSKSICPGSKMSLENLNSPYGIQRLKKVKSFPGCWLY